MEEQKQEKNSLHSFNFEDFRKKTEAMIEINNNDYFSSYLKTGKMIDENYDLKDVQDILSSHNILTQRKLSNDFYNTNGYYKSLISYYTTLLDYSYLLVPNIIKGRSLQDQSIIKKYNLVLNFLSNSNIKKLAQDIAFSILLNGRYYGILSEKNKKTLNFFELPNNYCRSKYKNLNNELLLEFNVSYFYTIDEDDRQEILSFYPKIISNHFKRWDKGREKKPWVLIPSNMGVVFQLFNPRPFFLNTIPQIIKYQENINDSLEKNKEEIKKIVILEIPHLNDGTLLFEPDEALTMHKGAVEMLTKKNPNVSVLTTYGNTKVESSDTNNSTTNNLIDKTSDGLYSSAGTSKEILSASGSSSIPYSLSKDISIMMNFAEQYFLFITKIINEIFGSNIISFKCVPLAISQLNRKDFIDQSFKMASSGYSALLPSIAQGLNQSDFYNTKKLENDLLKLNEIMLPLTSGFNSNQDSSDNGRPKLNPGEEKEQTIKNKESKDNTNN